jgi:hypothetical protein
MKKSLKMFLKLAIVLISQFVIAVLVVFAMGPGNFSALQQTTAAQDCAIAGMEKIQLNRFKINNAFSTRYGDTVSVLVDAVDGDKQPHSVSCLYRLESVFTDYNRFRHDPFDVHVSAGALLDLKKQ